MIKYTTSLRQISASGDLETAIEQLYRRLRTSLNKELSKSSLQIEQEVTPTDYQYSNILVDNGSGRITSGLKSLELLSILCSGTSPQNLFLFDNIIYYGTVNDFKTKNDVDLIKIIIENLGMTAVINNLPSNITQEYKNICLKIAKLVKTGSYTADKYSAYIKTNSKKLVKIYIDN